MKNLNLNFELKTLDGDSVVNNKGKHEKAGSVLAQTLVNTPKGDALKHINWAISLNAGKPIELDDSDWEYLKTFVKDNDSMFIIAKGPILKAMLQAESGETKPSK